MATPARSLRGNGRSEESEPARGRDFVGSLAKGLEILSAFSQGDLLGNQQLVARTGLPKATVSRLTSTLAELGYLRRDEATRKFFMGTRLLGMGASVQRNIGLQRTARPFMEALSRETEMSVGMGTRDRLGVVFLEIVRPPNNRLVVNSDAGTVLPIESTAIGLSYLVAAPVRERGAMLQGLQKRHPEDWARVRETIAAAHEEFARDGYVSSQRSWGRDVSAVAAPLLLGARRGLFVFNCAGSAQQLPRQQLRRRLGPRLREMVEAIRQEMSEHPQQRLDPPAVHEP